MGADAQIADILPHDNHRGVWIRSHAAEAFVAVEPVFRVLDFRRVGEETLLAGSEGAEAGLRLAMMEPNQVPTSFDVGAQRGRLVEVSDGAAVVELERDPSGLRYIVRLAMAEEGAQLNLHYTLRNESDRERRLAIWSVLAFERDGRMVIPFGGGQEPGAHAPRRRLVLPRWAVWPQPGATWGRDALLLDAGGEMAGHVYKLGVVTENGWIAFWRGGRAVVSHVAFDPAGVYPEDGANVTAFAFEGEDRAWAEIEQVGPLRSLAPGEAVEMSERLFLVEVAEPEGADAARRAIAEALEAAGAWRKAEE